MRNANGCADSECGQLFCDLREREREGVDGMGGIGREGGRTEIE